MRDHEFHDIPAADPVTGGELYVSELTAKESGITIRGKFAIPRYAKLDKDHAKFLETFLRCRGMLSSVEKEMGLSYPTVRARLDALLTALDLTPVKVETKEKVSASERQRLVLEQLERGEITAEEAKQRMREGA